MPPAPNDAADPPRGGARALEIAIAHEQVLLSSIAGFDGKLMLLTVLNVAGISALVGIAASADPVAWLFGLSMASCALCALAGLGNLWAEMLINSPRRMRRSAQPKRMRSVKRRSRGCICKLCAG